MTEGQFESLPPRDSAEAATHIARLTEDLVREVLTVRPPTT